jgi:ethanolamine utilization protein EutJ
MNIDIAANRKIQAFEAVLAPHVPDLSPGPLFVGVDLGTAYIVTAVVDITGSPVAGVLTRSRSSIRDGLVLDYVGAMSILKTQVQSLRNKGLSLAQAAAAYPPGTVGRNAQVFGHVLQSARLEVATLTDEPTAASKVLGIQDGAVVDIGGGTTGISVLRGGEVVYTADEPTGGTHIDLVLAGHFKISDHEAEQIKCDPARQREVFPLIRPVFQKMGTIVARHLKENPVDTIYLVGGTSGFPGAEEVVAEETGLPVVKPENPLLVTPLGIALSCREALCTDQKCGAPCMAAAG